MSNSMSVDEESSIRSSDPIRKYARLGNGKNNSQNYMGPRKRAKVQTILDKQGRQERDWKENLRCYGCEEEEEDDDDDEEEEEEEEEDEIGVKSEEERSPKGRKQGGSGKRGPMDMITNHAQLNTSTNMKKQNDEINEDSLKGLRDQACSSLARWMYDAGIDLKAVKYDSFQEMVNAIGECGPGFKAPTAHEVSGPLLKEEVEVVNKQMKEHKEEWKKHGCSIMLDGWSDKRERTLVNFLVSGVKGSMFVKSVDASKYCKSDIKMLEFLSSFVEKVGPENVVHVVTDSASADMKLAGEMLMVKYKNLYWTPCAAHSLELMLEDIYEIPRIKRVFAMAMKLNRFIYNRQGVVDLMRKFTRLKLVRHAKTHFTTAFLTLERINLVKKDLRSMFQSDAWKNSEWAKELQGKQACKTVMNARFWKVAFEALKVAGPLIKVIRMVNGESKPAMGYICEAMHSAKETIAKNFGDNEKKYIEYFKIIDARWESELYHPLHAAGYYLNPEFFNKNEGFERDKDVMGGLFKCLERVVPGLDMQDKICEELIVYMKADGLFGTEIAKRQRATRSPVEWWMKFGAGSPNLQAFAIKILSLTCIASTCERNSSFLEHIHSKKRNGVAQAQLNDMVYVKYNRALRRTYMQRDRIDPITVVDIDVSNEWFVAEDDEVHEGCEKVCSTNILPLVDDEEEEEEFEPIIYNWEEEEKVLETLMCNSGSEDV